MFHFSDSDLRLLKVFKTVVDNSGFAAAQTELNIGTSTISNHMATLERRLGTKLCQRGRVGFQLTDKGEFVYEAAKRLFTAVNDFSGDMASIRGQLTGSLNLGLLDSVISNGRSPIHEAIRRFNARENDTQIQVQVEELQAMEKLLLDGQLHLVIGCFPRKINGLNYEYIYSERQELYCGRLHPLFQRQQGEINVQDLTQYRVVSRSMWMQTELARVMAESASALVTDVAAKASLIRTGAYIGFLPKHYGDIWVGSGDLRSLLPQVMNWSAPYFLATRKGFSRTLVMNTFLDDFWAAASELALDEEL
ncbi:MAG: LysR family transcriptional regulator [Alphaproteobacteria bacterium]|nr:LysR family transcriptional regulator [Alphaproteobacteria bacterium]